MKKVVTFGEIILRLSTLGYERFGQADSFDIVYGGAEADVAASLANYGYDTYIVSKLPKNDIGQAAINQLKKFNVNTDYIVRGGDRIGVYFLETGASMRPSKIIYDRANSSIAEADISDFDFDEIFKDATWFHFSGITPAISDKATILTEEALKSAKRYNVTVSADFNYRSNLWTIEKAHKVMTNLMQYVDVCFDAHSTLLLEPGNTDFIPKELSLSDFKDIFKRMIDKFGFKYVVNSMRKSYSASDNGWSACAYDGNEFYQSKEYNLRIVDRVGGGDSYVAGVIAGLMAGKGIKDALEFGVAASALKHTIHGDFNMASVQEVEGVRGCFKRNTP